jgi:hypothetical protein
MENFQKTLEIDQKASIRMSVAIVTSGTKRLYYAEAIAAFLVAESIL